MAEKIDVQDLQVGMFVHLDLSWMSHPFPLSSFRIGSAEQIDTLRGLGLTKVRWSPERSDACWHQGGAVPPSAEDAGPADASAQAAATLTVTVTPQVGLSSADPLQAQIKAIHLCERQFGEACRDLRRINDAVLGEPEAAHRAASRLAQALSDKMLTGGDLCVRVIEEVQTDRLTAHAMNVTVIALLLGQALELSATELAELGVGALFHDVGKLELPDRLRLPQHDFTATETQCYQEHVARGERLGQRMGLGEGVLRIIAQHHEMADRSGYPAGLALDDMSQGARIVAMVNHYDNLCNAAVPTRCLTPHEALSRMFAQSRHRFDPGLLNAFIRLMGIYPPGSLVQLSDDRYAMVMTVNPARPLRPRVLVVEPAVPREQALHMDLGSVPDLGIRRSLRADQLPARAVDYLAPRPRVAYFFDIEAAGTEGA